MPEISVIVPVYNGVRYADAFFKAVDSLDYDDREIVLVVDSKSTDGSVGYFQGIAKNRTDLRVIVQDDSGKAGGARNLGLRNAEGRYVAFFDIDDVPYPGYLSQMHNAIVEEHGDVVFCHYVNSVPKSFEYGCETSSVTRDEAICMVTEGILPGMPWGSMWSTDVIFGNSLEYPVGTVAEDTDFILRALAYVERIAIYNGPLYVYFESDNSKDPRYRIISRAKVYYDLISYYESNVPSVVNRYARLAYLIQIRWGFRRPTSEYREFSESEFSKEWRSLIGGKGVEISMASNLPGLYRRCIRLFSWLLNILGASGIKHKLY